MAKEFVVWCDICLSKDDARNPSQTHVVALNDKGFSIDKPLSIDLCSQHHTELIAPLAAALGQHGEKIDPNAPTSPNIGPRPAMPKRHGNFPCLLCEAKFNSNYTFVQHLAAVHEVSGPQSLFGDRCPVCNTGYKAGAGLGAHISREHQDWGGTTSEVFAKVKEAGDQHGVVAARLDAMGHVATEVSAK